VRLRRRALRGGRGKRVPFRALGRAFRGRRGSRAPRAPPDGRVLRPRVRRTPCLAALRARPPRAVRSPGALARLRRRRVGVGVLAQLARDLRLLLDRALRRPGGRPARLAHGPAFIRRLAVLRVAGPPGGPRRRAPCRRCRRGAAGRGPCREGTEGAARGGLPTRLGGLAGGARVPRCARGRAALPPREGGPAAQHHDSRARLGGRPRLDAPRARRGPPRRRGHVRGGRGRRGRDLRRGPGQGPLRRRHGLGVPERERSRRLPLFSLRGGRAGPAARCGELVSGRVGSGAT
jgi:hypothetical protein